MAAIIRHFMGQSAPGVHAGCAQMGGRSCICADLLPKINELLIKWAQKFFVSGCYCWLIAAGCPSGVTTTPRFTTIAGVDRRARFSSGLLS